MVTFETTKTAFISKLTRLKDQLFNKNSSSVYDMLRPVFYCSLLFGMTQFDVRKKKFEEFPWILLWNGAIVAVTTCLAVIAIISREFESSIGIIYNITDVSLAWVSVINNVIIIIFGCIFKNKVNAYTY